MRGTGISVLLWLASAACATRLPATPPSGIAVQRRSTGGNDGPHERLPAWLTAEPALSSLGLEQRCKLLATALTFQSSATGTRLPSAFETAETEDLARQSHKFWAAATVIADDDARTERSLFASGESCGERLLLFTPRVDAAPADIESYAKLELTGSSAKDFSFRLRFERLDDAPSSSAYVPLSGRITLGRSGEWDILVDGAEASRQRRSLDAAPREAALVPPLAAGLVEAGFEIETGRDSMGAPAHEAGLIVVVRYADRELRHATNSLAMMPIVTSCIRCTDFSCIRQS
jgi:hypothetical protein